MIVNLKTGKPWISQRCLMREIVAQLKDLEEVFEMARMARIQQRGCFDKPDGSLRVLH